METAPEFRDRLTSQSPQPNLQEVLFVMGGRSLDDSDDDDSDDEDRDPRLQRLLHKNCAFYNTKTSTNVYRLYQASKFVQIFVGKCSSKFQVKTKRFGRCIVGH